MSRLQHFCKLTERSRVLGLEQHGYVTRFDRHMFDREWTLNHADDHAAAQASIDAPMGGVHRNQHGFFSFDGLMLCPNDNNSFPLQAQHDFIRDGMRCRLFCCPG